MFSTHGYDADQFNALSDTDKAYLLHIMLINQNMIGERDEDAEKRVGGKLREYFREPYGM